MESRDGTQEQGTKNTHVSPHQLDTEEHHVERKHGDAEASGHAELAHDDRDDNGEQHKK